jgi:hypothetical protein
MQTLSTEAELKSEPKSVDWSEVMLSLIRNNDLLSVKILEKLYVNPAEPYIADALVKQIRPRAKAITIRRHARKLERLGLIKVVGKSPMSFWPLASIQPGEIVRLKKLVYGHILGEINAD